MIQAGFYLASMKRGQVGWHVGLWAVLLGVVPTHMAGQLKLSADFHASVLWPKRATTRMRSRLRIRRTSLCLPVAATAIELSGVLPAKGVRAFRFQQRQCFF